MQRCAKRILGGLAGRGLGTRRGRHGRGLPRRGTRRPAAGRQTGAGRTCRGPDLPGPLPSGGAGGTDRGRTRDVHRPCRRCGHRGPTALDGLGVHRRPNLRDAVLDHGPLPEEAVRSRYRSVLSEALIAIHGQGMVHRDLKPSNILLAQDGPRVIDFGIVRALEGDRADPHRDRGRLGRVRLARADPQQRPGGAPERRLRARRSPRVRGGRGGAAVRRGPGRGGP